jgi:LPXTG-site transpeptidase (sortase) family protein
MRAEAAGTQRGEVVMTRNKMALAMVAAGGLLVAGCGALYLEAATYQLLASNVALQEIAKLITGGAISEGRIEIARIGLDAAIREGIDAHTLNIAVGHVPGTARPGDRGNVVLTGHRDSFFRALRKVRAGDTVKVLWGEGPILYLVESTTVVERDATQVMDPSEDHVLTLITCYPFGFIGRAPQRFIVRARQILPMPRAQAAAAGGTSEWS